ncbi:MAG TPA: hypothetical protein VJS67_12405 [Pseudonocardiaceae bacterium]|nr:hypothetical protein [Pseudonocardiaceae bacterium]
MTVVVIVAIVTIATIAKLENVRDPHTLPSLFLPGSSAARGIPALEKQRAITNPWLMELLVTGTKAQADDHSLRRGARPARPSPASSNRGRFIVRALLAAQGYPLVANAMQSQAIITPSGEEASHDSARLADYRGLFDELCGIASFGHTARQILRRIADDYRSL